MHHYFNAITNSKGDALTGYYVRLSDDNGDGVSLYADTSLTPIVSVSGVDDAAKVDSDGNVDFYVDVGTYQLDIYATDSTTLVKSIANMPMLLDTESSGVNTGDETSATILSKLSGQALAVASVTATGAITSSGATSGIGYAAGSGGAVTQATSRTTGVTLNTVCGAITLVSAAGSTSWQTFTVTNSAVAASDVIRVVQQSGTDLYQIHVTKVAAGSFNISFATTGGTTTEQPVFNFAVIKAVAA